MANQKQYFEAKDELLSTIMKTAQTHELDSFQIISLLSSLTAEIADMQRKATEDKKEDKKEEYRNLLGKRVQVNVGNDTCATVIYPGVP